VFPLKTLLCPTDQSEIAGRALDYAIAIARRFDSLLSVIEVLDWELPPIPGHSFSIPEIEIPKELRATALSALNEFVAPARAAGVATELSLETGNVVRRILARATGIGADVIVLGTHGRTGFQHFALGSIAEKILRSASCPVLTVPPGAAAVVTPLFQTILCATDFSDQAGTAVRAARQLAQQLGGRLILLHVVDWPFGETTGKDAVGELRRSLISTAEQHLARLVDETADCGASVEPLVAVGVAKREILSTVTTHRVELIVMGLSGRGSLDLAVLGSTTHNVIRQAVCPVLTIRRNRPAE